MFLSSILPESFNFSGNTFSWLLFFCLIFYFTLTLDFQLLSSCHCHIESHSQQGSQGATITTVVYGLECSSTPPPYKPCHPVRTVSQDTDPHQGKWPTHPWYPSFHPPQRRKGLCLGRSGHLAQWGQTKDPTHTEASVPYQQFSVGLGFTDAQCSPLSIVQ